jgi:cobalt-zinc-cadmium efflux system outer membrane protein
MKQPIVLYLLLCLLISPLCASAEAFANASKPLCLKTAHALALEFNPDVKEALHALAATEALVRQARALPNPELNMEAEEINRNGTGFDDIEMSLGLGQRIEAGGKRRFRTLAAIASHALSNADYEQVCREVLANTSVSFLNVLVSQQRVALAQSALDLANKMHAAVSDRVDAGKAPPLQASKAEAEREMVKLRGQEAEQALQTGRRELVAIWGLDAASFTRADGNLLQVPETLPALHHLTTSLSDNPILARCDAQVSLQRAILNAEKAERIPDIDASIKYVQYEEDGTDAFAFGVGIPLPLFNRNRGNIDAASHLVASAETRRKAQALKLTVDLQNAYSGLNLSHQRAITIDTIVIPAMQQTLSAAQEGYRQGKFDFLEMLDAQRSLMEAEEALLDAQMAYQLAAIRIEQLTGWNVNTNMEKQQ